MSEQSAPSTRQVARTRGAASGILLVLLGAWGGLAAFIGPLFNFGFTPDKSWHWTAARGWYEVAPGAVTVVGGLLLLMGTSRLTTLLGAWLGILAGGWLVIGPAVSSELTLGSLGTPLGNNGGIRVLEQISFFYLLGAVIIFLAAAAFGRLSVVTVRDVKVAERREAARIEAEELAARETAEREAREREAAQRRADAERETAEREAAERAGAEQAAAQRNSDNRAAAEQHAFERNDQPADAQQSPPAQEPERYNPYSQNQYDQSSSPAQQPGGYPSAPPPPAPQR